jgi:1-acyl-sn-glycerol-3-phosphate acyltransferase
MRLKLLNIVLFMLRLTLTKPEVSGKENVPPTGPLIVMINHIHALDPYVVVAVFPRPVTAMAKIEVFDVPIFGFLTRAYGVIPIQRGQVDMHAVRRSLEVLQAGGALLIAPEGTRSPTNSLQQGKEGMAFIAARTGAPVIPVGVTGTEDAESCWRRLRRVPVRVSIGKPFRLDAGDEPPRRRVLRAMTDEAMYQLAAILPPEYRGVYGDIDEASTGKIDEHP